MEKGWSAKDRLSAFWGRVGGRDGLARLTGISGQTLSAYNSGARQLGLKNGPKIAAALGVSLIDLGGPADDRQPADRLVVDRLAELEALVGRFVEDADKDLRDLEQRVGVLETQARPTRRRGQR